MNECLAKYPEAAFTPLNRYVKISQHLPGKTIRDIGQKVKALRGEVPVALETVHLTRRALD